MSYLMESEAPRDFRISSTESDGHYTKCLLCYTVKKIFYCSDCVQNGSFIHSAMPYSDRYSEKQVKLLRLKRNRQHILDRCNKLLSPKLQRDILITETKRAKDQLDLLKLAVQQRKNNIEELKKELKDVKTYNNELSSKLPRYQKRVSSVDRLADGQKEKLRKQIENYNEHAEKLAALRRSRIRQLIRYIFPVYISYDTSDSIEDMEFIGDEDEGPPPRPQLHIVAPWIDVDCDSSQFQACISANREVSGGGESVLPVPAAGRARAALGLAAQLVALLAWTLDVRLPHAINLTEYSEGRGSGGWRGCAGRVRAGAAALCARAALPPDAPLAGLHALALAAAADLPALGRVEASPDECGEWGGAWEEAWAEGEADEPEPPEHLHWPEAAEVASASAAPAASLVTSLASMWRGWTK